MWVSGTQFHVYHARALDLCTAFGFFIFFFNKIGRHGYIQEIYDAAMCAGEIYHRHNIYAIVHWMDGFRNKTNGIFMAHFECSL